MPGPRVLPYAAMIRRPERSVHMMIRTPWVMALLLAARMSHAQLGLGAAVGWSHSRVLDQGGPLVSVLAEHRAPSRLLRTSVDLQLPSTVYSYFVDAGNGTGPFPGRWTDGQRRAVTTSRSMSMLCLGIDHLFLIEAGREKNRLELQLGPSIAYMAEQTRTDRRVENRADTSSFFEQTHDRRRSATLRATLCGAYRLPLGTLLLGSTVDLFTWPSNTPASGRSWFQRQAFRIGAVFPLAKP
jgi:hypothetical protein